MKKKQKLSLFIIVLLVTLALTAVTAFGYRKFAGDPMTGQPVNCSTTCHYTIKASDINKLPYVKVVNYAIVKNVFTLSKGKFYPSKPITNAEFRQALQRASNLNDISLIPNDNKTFTRAQLAYYIMRLLNTSSTGANWINIIDFNGSEPLAWAVEKGYLPITKKAGTKVYAYPNALATRADAAYAIVTAGLIRQTAASKPSAIANTSKHSDLTSSFLTWVQNNPTGTAAEFCLTCHGKNATVDKWNSIKNIVYTNHYLNRTFTKNGDTVFWMAYQFGQRGNPKLPYDLYMNQDNLHNAAKQNSGLARIEGFRELGFAPGQLQFGMYNRLCGAPETFGFQSFLGRWNGTDGKSRAAGCGRCHIGYGKKSGPADPNYNNGLFNQISGDVDAAILDYVKDIDCLLCHADQYYVNKGAARNVKIEGGKATIYTVGEVYNGQDPSITDYQQKVLTAIASVYKKPTANGCAVCHDFPADGPAYKRGFWHSLDVHLKDDKLSCVDCHSGGAWTPAISDTTGQGVYNKHQFVIGPMPDLYTPNDGNRAKQCTDCHTGTVHANAVINDHTRRIDCRTCHISKDYGLDYRDFSNPERETADGIYEPKDYVFNNWTDQSLYNNNSHEYKGSFGTPTLNFKQQDYEHMMRFGVRPIGDIFDEGKLLGDMGKMNYPQNLYAKIQPFHRVNIKIPMAFGNVYFKAIGKDFVNFPFMLPFDKKNYAETGDIIQSVYQGIYKLKTLFMPAFDMNNQIYFGDQKVPKFDGYTAQMIYSKMLNENIMTNPRMSMTSTSKGFTPFNMSGYYQFFGLMQMDHTVLPADEALTCIDCHSDTGRVVMTTDSWKNLGYSAKRSKLLVFTKK
ncbi:cytochrome c3 family protein [Carboxydothermus pertinax]|uniref:Cytochrome c7-like domain-containing protein n=1 Tax=Carboxydothermus pertinax TaxID=870242 RepID=A0A1L8CVK9_9THEO|nr:cytochrome c3 family protein [Carboxydothermus pertinax]GAV22950.1 hypothetical protein cpu_14600 [Carboxydothermus pertinax]